MLRGDFASLGRGSREVPISPCELERFSQFVTIILDDGVNFASDIAGQQPTRTRRDVGKRQGIALRDLVSITPALVPFRVASKDSLA